MGSLFEPILLEKSSGIRLDLETDDLDLPSRSWTLGWWLRPALIYHFFSDVQVQLTSFDNLLKVKLAMKYLRSSSSSQGMAVDIRYITFARYNRSILSRYRVLEL